MKLATFHIYIISFIGQLAGQGCDQVVARPNIYKMSESDRNRYFNAVKAVNSGSKPSEWDKFAKQHFVYSNRIHTKPMFHPWHRKYLAELEVKLRKYDPSVRIPYWDWSEYYNKRDKDPIWRWYAKGGNQSKGNCVTEGVFKDFKVFYDGRGNSNGRERCMTRSSQVGSSFGCNMQFINPKIIDNTNVGNSLDKIENSCHNGVHNNIGEDFSTHISPNDPLFYSHHAFVDMLWFIRQNRYPERYDEFPESLNNKLPWWEIPIRDVLDTRTMCYTYEEDRYSFKSDSNSMSDESSERSKVVEPFIPLTQSKNAPGALSVQEIDEHARKYVFKNITSPVNKPPSQIQGSKCEIYSLQDIVSINYIRMMNSDEKHVRELEREQAIFMDDLNKKCL